MNAQDNMRKYNELLQSPELRARAGLEDYCAFVLGGILTHILGPAKFQKADPELERFQLRMMSMGSAFSGAKAPASLTEQGELLVKKLEDQRLYARAFALSYTLKIAFQSLDDDDQVLRFCGECMRLYDALSPAEKQRCAMDYHGAQGTAESLAALAAARERVVQTPGDSENTATYRSLHEELSAMHDALLDSVWKPPSK